MFILSLLACLGPALPTCDEVGTGTLDITLDVPAEVWETSPALDVYGPDGASYTSVEADTVLVVPGGLYTFAVRRATVAPVSGPVGTAYGRLEETAFHVCVSDEQTELVEVSWELQPSSGKLWATSGESAYGFDAETLAAGGAVTPALDLLVEASNDLRGMAVDPLGNLWVATSPTYGTRLVVYPPGGADGSSAGSGADGGSDGSSAGMEIGGDLLADVAVDAIRFGGGDQLWMLVRSVLTDEPAIWSFDTAQALLFVASGQLPTAPAQQLTVEGMVAPEDFDFGPDGRLWIADFGGNQVLQVNVGKAATADPQVITPEDTFLAGWEDGTGAHSLDGPTALGFDATGRLWVNYWTSVTMARFDGSPTVGGSRVPDLLAAGDVLDLPAGVAGDRTGGIWYGNEPQNGTGELVQLAAGYGAELSRATSADALAPTLLMFDPR